ncbi:hypothetical protein SAMN02800692_1538 [Luteibacter sp. UNC138MFCol5.1]|uniref:hypothetical protein n=1 Tax=Luteibacter sp. UNC138MFCol5.1 TaxID=1502774 RepID=UPI0008C195E2|nr:hypothetical protein [Luteibacter sp. UNC138MFCol5.1]SEO63824.1 hypothetical protein SAMN02800692_1538 [Luteibacter sp. UNC138MFCol5.1]
MPDDLLARIGGELQRYEVEREANRARHPFAMEIVDGLRAVGIKPRVVHAVNAAGEVLGKPPVLPGIGVDGDKLAHLPEYEAAWRRILGKQPDNRQTYNLRAQRAIKPNAWRVDE